MIKKIINKLKLPSPKELERSNSNALPVRNFNFCNEYTWEDYYEELKVKYPIKYFIFHFLKRKIQYKIINPLIRLKYFIVSHTIRKYHIIDIRNKHNEYDYGYIDADYKILFALVAILNEFIQVQDTHNKIIYLEKELAIDPECKIYNWKENIKICQELLDIQYWWNIERPKMIKLEYSESIYDYDFTNKIRQKDNDMMKKLIDLRETMWL